MKINKIILKKLKLELMDKIASKSKLTIEDVDEINEKIKVNLYSNIKNGIYS